MFWSKDCGLRGEGEDLKLKLYRMGRGVLAGGGGDLQLTL